jgi:hypothetical protein
MNRAFEKWERMMWAAQAANQAQIDNQPLWSCGPHNARPIVLDDESVGISITFRQGQQAFTEELTMDEAESLARFILGEDDCLHCEGPCDLSEPGAPQMSNDAKEVM